jgi:hypothetical protein
LLTLVTLLSLVVTGGLGSSAPQDQPSIQLVDPETGRFSVATFNTGLAHGAVPFASQRRALLAEALNALATDVLCLQEVWTDEDAEALISALIPVYPFSYRMKTEATSPKAAKCGLFKALKLNRCVKSKCTSQGTSVFECVQGECEEAYEALGADCQRCLAANSNHAWRCASGLFRANEYVYGGRNGLLLLSRHKIERSQYIPGGEAARYNRILDQVVELEAGGKVHETRLSDHYGLRLDWETQRE